MVEVYLFEYNEDHPYSKLLYELQPYHYKHMTSYRGEFSFTVYGNDFKLIPSGQYSLAMCIEVISMIADTPPEYRYFVVPAVTVDLRADETGLRINALAVFMDYVGQDEIDLVKGVMIVKDKHFKITEQTFSNLRLLGG
jgi:hypothetical protein